MKWNCGLSLVLLALFPCPSLQYFIYALDCAYLCAYNCSMEIVWDLEKATANPKRHDGVTFEEAKQVLFDPFALTHEDHDALNEQRFVTLGMGAKGRILVVVYSHRGETIRLISPQRRRYEEQFR
jgi:uncharacterized DUF497 family protein